MFKQCQKNKDSKFWRVVVTALVSGHLEASRRLEKRRPRGVGDKEKYAAFNFHYGGFGSESVNIRVYLILGGDGNRWK